MRPLIFIMIALLAWAFWPEAVDVDRKDISAGLIQKLYTPPVQINGTYEPFVTEKGHFQFLASYDVTAKVLGRENYYFDRQSKVSPMDFALGWGPMAQPDIVKLISVTQSLRWYHYKWSRPLPIPREQVSLNSANVHIIPANDRVKKKLNSIKKYDIIHLKGYLVYYYRTHKGSPDKRDEWRSSMTRSDRGDGSCEVMYVESVTVY